MAGDKTSAVAPEEPRRHQSQAVVGADPYFTVIIPTYERSAMLAEAVTSVVRQTFRGWELIVVDDASPTPVPPYDDTRITVLRNESNLGKAASVNRALEQARGVVVAFLDDDDAWAATRLTHARTAHGKADVVVCLGGEVGATAPTPRWRLARNRRALSSRHREHGPIAGMGMTSVRRDVAPLFDPAFLACEDVDWAIRLWQATRNVEVIPYEDFLWRRHDALRHNNGHDARLTGNVLLLEKHLQYYETHPPAHAHRLSQHARRLAMDGQADQAWVFACRAASTALTPQSVRQLANAGRKRALGRTRAWRQ